MYTVTTDVVSLIAVFAAKIPIRSLAVGLPEAG